MMGAKKPGLTGLARESADGSDSGASVTLARGAIVRLLEGRVRPQRLPDLRTRSSSRARRRNSRGAGAASGARSARPQRFRRHQNQPRLCAAGEIARLRRARDPSARHGLCRSRTRRELPAVRPARDQSASRRDGAALAFRRQRRKDSAAPSRARHQHLLGDRRYHRTERRHRNHSGKPSVGRAIYRRARYSPPISPTKPNTTRATGRTPSS